MADIFDASATTTTEGAPNVEEGTVQEPQAVSEENPSTEEPEVQLPSDVEEVEIPEKFQGKSVEEIVKAYQELEKKLGAPKEEQPPEQPKPEEGNPEEGGINGAEVFQEYIEKGELSEETMSKLKELGYKEEEVLDRLEYEKYKQEKAISSLVEPIGGFEEYTKMQQWANENVDPSELKQFNEEFAAAGEMAKKAMLKDAYARYKAAISGEEVNLLHTNEPQQVATKGYTSQHELQKDLSDPRYGIDRSYTQEVEKKLARSDLSKI